MRPIDADVLVSAIESARNMFFPNPYERRFHEDSIEFALNMVEDVPTIDYVPRQQWISVKDRLPEFRDWVLVIGKFVPEGYWIVPHIAEFRNGVWHSDDIDCTPLEERALTVTHWMPLPEPPKEEEE